MSSTRADGRHVRVTGWVGWVWFVGILLTAAGFVNLIQGVVALVDQEFYLVSASGLAVGVDYAIWGWTLIVLGAILLAGGYGVIRGRPWGRVIGVVAATVNALVNLGFVAAYPAWSLLAVALAILAVYGLVVHGGDVVSSVRDDAATPGPAQR